MNTVYQSEHRLLNRTAFTFQSSFRNPTLVAFPTLVTFPTSFNFPSPFNFPTPFIPAQIPTGSRSHLRTHSLSLSPSLLLSLRPVQTQPFLGSLSLLAEPSSRGDPRQTAFKKEEGHLSALPQFTMRVLFAGASFVTHHKDLDDQLQQDQVVDGLIGGGVAVFR